MPALPRRADDACWVAVTLAAFCLPWFRPWGPWATLAAFALFACRGWLYARAVAWLLRRGPACACHSPLRLWLWSVLG